MQGEVMYTCPQCKYQGYAECSVAIHDPQVFENKYSNSKPVSKPSISIFIVCEKCNHQTHYKISEFTKTISGRIVKENHAESTDITEKSAV